MADDPKKIAQETKKEEKPTTPPAKATKESKVEVSTKLQKIIDEVEKLSVLELSQLVKALEEKFGVSAAAPVAVAAVPAGGGGGTTGGEATTEEKSEFTIVLASVGANKIAVIKAVREINPELGLKDAKDLVDQAPKTVAENVAKEAAEEAKKKLEAAGAQIELK